VQIASSYLQRQDGSRASVPAVEARAGGRRFLIGVGVGKLVAAGTDVGLSPAAQRCLDVLLDRARMQDVLPSLNFVPIRPDLSATDCVRYALLLANDGDVVFFIVDDAPGCHAVMQAVNVQASPIWKMVRSGSS
jgi:hypothetical protein